VGLDHVDHFLSVAGLPLYKGHEYEVVSVYENTSGEEQDSMAVFNLYLRDKEFKKPDLSAPAAKPSRAAPPAASSPSS
jgi:hypothetical protein